MSDLPIPPEAIEPSTIAEKLCPVCEGNGCNLEFDPVVGDWLAWPCVACRQTGRADRHFEEDADGE